ncbi:ABC transporter substrate-binding protein [Bradyrhizobium sp. Pha-3]|uniref:ABC transporter substrate-binding protein n=1 Tax=Bradyrhizobium sp. Pha-3 TaxID=208375 RepID=UPI0035D3E9B7
MLSGRHASAASGAHLIRALGWTARGCDVHIAAVRPMSGSSDASGALMRDGAAAAVETLNGSGLLADTKVTSSIANGACDPRQAVAVANKLTTDQVRRVAGHCCSASSVPGSDVFDKAGIIQRLPGAANPQLTELGSKTVFRICGNDGQQGVVAAIEHSARTQRLTKFNQ